MLPRLVNAMEDIPISIFYDWSDGGNNKTYGTITVLCRCRWSLVSRLCTGEDNFGVVESVYHNSSLPRTPKPAYHAATTLQTLLGHRAFVQRLPVAVGANYSDTDSYALEFEGSYVALWKTDGVMACSDQQRQYDDCGTCASAIAQYCTTWMLSCLFSLIMGYQAFRASASKSACLAAAASGQIRRCAHGVRSLV